MCGVKAFQSSSPMRLGFVDLKEIGIRGLHSTGVSWLQDGEIKTKIDHVPYYEFEMPEVETTAAIFHCRYSTSHYEYPQPVFNRNKSIVHNGVITQSSPSTWGEKYGYYGDSKCDSVLLLDSEDPLKDFPEASLAVIELTLEGIKWYRNGLRPLYEYISDEITIIGSTQRSVPAGGRLVKCNGKDLQ